MASNGRIAVMEELRAITENIRTVSGPCAETRVQDVSNRKQKR
jgi:hypothetical protein